MDRACELQKAGKEEEALEILFEAESRLDETVEPEVKVNLYTALAAPYYDSYIHRFGTSRVYAEKAIRVAREADSVRWLPTLLWNLVINTHDADSVNSLLRECRDVSDLCGNMHMSGRARINLANVAMMQGRFEEAESILDSVGWSTAQRDFVGVEYDLERATLHQLQGDVPAAISILKAISPDSLTLDGNRGRYASLYEMARKMGRYDEAMDYRDSLALCQDSMINIISSEKLSKVESHYAQTLIREEGKLRLVWCIGGGIVLLLITGLLFLARSRRMKIRQIGLVEKISQLNLRLSELEAKDPEASTPSDKISALVEKFRLTKEFYLTLPQSVCIEQLNMEPNSEDIPKDRLKSATDSIIGNFSEACGNLRQMVEAVTPDDALMCVLYFAGMRREVVEVVMKVSEDALRKRKSRVKQKLPPPLFELFFSK